MTTEKLVRIDAGIPAPEKAERAKTDKRIGSKPKNGFDKNPQNINQKGKETNVTKLNRRLEEVAKQHGYDAKEFMPPSLVLSIFASAPEVPVALRIKSASILLPHELGNPSQDINISQTDNERVNDIMVDLASKMGVKFHD